MLNLGAFKVGSLSDASTLITMAIQKGMTIEELDTFLKKEIMGSRSKVASYKEVKKDFVKHDRKYGRVTRCPDCKQIMSIFEVNNSPSTMIGGKYKVALMCNNQDCMRVDYSEHPRAWHESREREGEK